MGKRGLGGLTRVRRVLVVALLCLSLWGCGVVNPSPAKAVVKDAIAQKVAQTQALLHQQLSPTDEPADLFTIGRVKITAHRWSTLADQPAVEVEGTYHLVGGSLGRGQRRQARSFDIFLRRGESKDEWVLMEPGLGG